MLIAGLCQRPDLRVLNLTYYGYSIVTQVGTAWLLEAFSRAILWTGFPLSVPWHGGTKADAIKPSKFKVQPLKQASNITTVD